ncbi:MAG: regulatory protein RecX [Gemmatimonadales bacterium]|nr:regulatory protein RecX [Gemmatimonadales bacterium]MYG49441.1 regulatory protein RecX [Gemmatimonadales bacterium]MYK02809.1 regulatory protein RecX [Candidatus Palauibacter ramosifaciens]
MHRLRLEVGLRLGFAELDAVQTARGRAEAMFVGLRYLSVRPRSRREVERRLWRDRIDQAAIQHALERLAALGYLDDSQFAASFARDRIRLRPCGTRRMQSDLLARGVSREDADRGISEAMAEEGATEEALLQRVAAARMRRLTGADPSRARRRLFDYLARRGFAASRIRAWIEVNWRAEDTR